MRLNKKGQQTVFIILSVLVIAGIISVFIAKGVGKSAVSYSPETDYNQFLSSCLEEKVRQTTNTILMHGGYMNPSLVKRFKFEGEKSSVDLAYLCYTEIPYISCVNQEPMIVQHIKAEIENEIRTDVENCFTELGQSLEKKDYVVEMFYDGFEVSLAPKKIIVDIQGEILYTKNEETKKIFNFTSTVYSRLYDLVIVAQEIVAQEARFCSFEQVGFALLYKTFSISKFRTGDSDLIYRITHKESEEEFQFAVRGCVIPPGM